MVDDASGRRIENAVEVQTVELTKYNLDNATIREAPAIEQWAFLLLHAQDFEADELMRLFPGNSFKAAIDTIEVISAKTEDKQMYDQRDKAQRDYEWAILGARQEGREEGREEGKLAGQILLLQQLLGDSPATDSELQANSVDALTAQVDELQKRLRDRQV